MGFRCGIVGLPNVGKSTLFNALTRAGVAAENYPFCTVEPHVGVIEVPDERLEMLARVVQPQRVIPTTLQFVDIAGLVAGASEGEGLGNRFLAHIREVDAIAQVVRCFTNQDIAHIAGEIDPAHDIETVENELLLADLEVLERALQRAARTAKGGEQGSLAYKRQLERMHDHVADGQPLRTLALDQEEYQTLKSLGLLTSKPMLYVANVAEDASADDRAVQAVIDHAHTQGSQVVVISAAAEAELAELEPTEREPFLADLGVTEPGLNRLVRAGYRLLGLVTFFTTQSNELRAWTVPEGTLAPQAAGQIHSDMEEGFIRAEVIPHTEFIEYGGEQGAREAGRVRTEGKEYCVQDGDVIHFRFHT